MTFARRSLVRQSDVKLHSHSIRLILRRSDLLSSAATFFAIPGG
jgi:hypothetical protein